MKHEVTVIRIEIGALEHKRSCGDYRNYRIVEIGQNTKKSPGDFAFFTNKPT